jgi:hypothetical protein
MQLNESDRLEKSVVKPLMTVVGKVRDASGTLRSATGGMVGGLLTPILTAMLLTIGGTQRATAVTNADRTALMPWSVGLLITKVSSPFPNLIGTTGLCTGTALSRHWIVTSAHCLQGRSYRTDTIEVYRESVTSNGIYSGKASYYSHPDYDYLVSGDKADDLGLVRLYGDGMVPDITAKIENGPNVTTPSRWKEGAAIFFVPGFGDGTDVGEGQACDDSNATSGHKRLGRLRLSGNTDDNGIVGLGNPIAVEGEVLDNNTCHGDSGAPWAFATGGNPRNEVRVFGVHSGWGLRSKPFLGTDKWAALLPPRMRWVTDLSKRKGLPINCPPFGEAGKEGSYRRCTEGYWMTSRGATEKWRRFQSVSTPLSNVHFGDFDGDGQAGDAFVSSADGLHYVLYAGAVDWTLVLSLLPGIGPFATRDRTKWTAFLTVQKSDVSAARLGVGDFDGDGVADVLSSRKGYLQVSFGTRDRTTWSKWTLVQSSDRAIEQLRFGDFDGDGVTDVFRKDDDNTWKVTYATKDRTARWFEWKPVGRSGEPLADLGFGDFDGNGTTDVLRSHAGAWSVSYSRKGHDRSRWGKWEKINRSRIPVKLLSFTDIDGDGRTDTIYVSPVRPEQ